MEPRVCSSTGFSKWKVLAQFRGALFVIIFILGGRLSLSLGYRAFHWAFSCFGQDFNRNITSLPHFFYPGAHLSPFQLCQLPSCSLTSEKKTSGGLYAW